MPSALTTPKVTMASHQHRILIYTTCYNVLDGVVLTIRKIEQEILAAGHHVCILTTKSGDPKNTHLDGQHPNRTVIFLDNAIPIPFLHDPNNPSSSYQLGFALSSTVKERIAEFEPSLVHITVPDCTCLHLIQYAREKEIPLMGTYHSNIPEYFAHYPGLGWMKHVLAGFFRHQYNFLQSLYVPTPFIRNYLTDTFEMDKVTDLGVWGRGIDLDRFSPKHRSQKFRQRMGFDEHDVVIMWCGRLVPEKRPDIFCKVVQRLHERNIPFRALVVGAGPVEEEVKGLPNTTFAGWMSGDELAVAYASCDVFLFPSAVETFGNVTLEAAASGLPLVVEAGCSGHLVNHGVNGFACTDDDVDAYFDSTLCLVIDDLRRKSMSSEGRNLSMQFEKRAVCRRMLEIYSKVSDDFYCVYGGHHSNRDKAYQNDASFVGGTHPRPLLLVFVERLFILLFMVLYQMASLFIFIRERLVIVPSSTVEEVQQAHRTQPVTVTPPPSRVSVEPALVSIAEVEECSDSSTDGSDMKDVELMKSDDDTESTTSLGEDSFSGRRSEMSFCCHPHNAEHPISHSLAIGFVNVVMFLFKHESRVRHLLSGNISTSSWSIMRRKRKNSSMAGDVLDLERVSSDESDGFSDDMEYLVNQGREERLNMRRTSSSVHVPILDL